MSDRYEARPWRRIVDSFVLWTIGALDERSTAQLEAKAHDPLAWAHAMTNLISADPARSSS